MADYRVLKIEVSPIDPLDFEKVCGMNCDDHGVSELWNGNITDGQNPDRKFLEGKLGKLELGTYEGYDTLIPGDVAYVHLVQVKSGRDWIFFDLIEPLEYEDDE